MILPETKPRRNGDFTTKRGESGTRHQASPDPRTTHSPKRKVQVACK
jgi:hypothetical protein